MEFSTRRTRRGVNLPNENILIHVMKDPPKSRHTRKKERISEADVTWMVRPDGDNSDSTRINEAISVLPKKVNPMTGRTAIDSAGASPVWENIGKDVSKKRSIAPMSFVDVTGAKQIRSPYAFDIVRPPIIPAEDLVSLVNPRLHRSKAVATNPGLREGVSIGAQFDKIDRDEIKRNLNDHGTSVSVASPLYFRVDEPAQQPIIMRDSTNIPLGKTIPTAPLPLFDIDQFKNVIDMNKVITDRDHYSMNSGMYQNISSQEPSNNIDFNKNISTPIHTPAYTNDGFPIWDSSIHYNDETTHLKDNTLVSYATPLTDMNPYMQKNVQYDLERNNPVYSTNSGTRALKIGTIQDLSPTLYRNSPVYSTNSGVKPTRLSDQQDLTPQLYRNNPIYSTNSGIRSLKIGEIQDLTPKLDSGKITTTYSTAKDRSNIGHTSSDQQLHSGLQVKTSLNHLSFENQGTIPKMSRSSIPLSHIQRTPINTSSSLQSGMGQYKSNIDSIFVQ